MTEQYFWTSNTGLSSVPDISGDVAALGTDLFSCAKPAFMDQPAPAAAH